MTEHEKAIRAALAAQIASEQRIRRAFDAELTASKARKPAPAKKSKPKPARDDSPLARMKRLARASGWQPPREKETEPGVLDGWRRFGGAR